MKKLISTRDIEALIRSGAGPEAIPADAILTPSARDMLNDMKNAPAAAKSAVAKPAEGAKVEPPKNMTAPGPQASQAEIEAFFNSPEMLALKEEICEIGRKLWAREYVDGNGGNISIRVSNDYVLCTPTMVSKGSLKPSDMCLVDMEGNQKAGHKKRTSEVLMHLQMMKAQPKAKACVHCHPPYATAFAMSGVVPPTCLIPEFEVFCSVGIAPYRTPGTPEMGKLISELTDKYNTILMANHGVVTWSHNNVEEAYWRMEIVEAFCRNCIVASQLGKPGQTFSPAQLKDLLKIKESLGFVDPRYGLKECELCDNSEWRPGVNCVVPAEQPAAGPAADPQAEELVKTITEMILAKLKK